MGHCPGPPHRASLVQSTCRTLPRRLSSDRQPQKIQSAHLWAITRGCKDHKSKDILLSATHGPSRRHVPGIVMTAEMEGSLALYAAKLCGTLGRMERSILATKVFRVWVTFPEVPEELPVFLEGCLQGRDRPPQRCGHAASMAAGTRGVAARN